MVANTGTYIDSPFHRYADGKDLAALGLEKLAGLDAVVVQVHGGARSGAGRDRRARSAGARSRGWRSRGRAVLVATGWDRHWRTDRYGRDNPFLTAEACERLRDAGVALVGIDSVNIDDLDDWARPAHSILLGAEIPIVEHMCNLTGLPDEGSRSAPCRPRWRDSARFR